VKNETYRGLNAQLNLFGDDGRIQLEKDKEAAHAYFLEVVNPNTVFFHTLEEKIDYMVDEGNEAQSYVVERIKAYAVEFGGRHSGRCLALLGNAGTGKTHLACAIGNHLLKNLNKTARFTSVAELNRMVRESKSYGSDVTESQVISDFAGYDLLIIDEVGMQSGTDAESRALFDVFNERYQQMKPTVLISNLDVSGFVQAVGKRISDRVKEDGGEILSFDWGSYRA